jgi:Cu(I)/Ag(I) efflux system membrane protein CusA/SilA
MAVALNIFGMLPIIWSTGVGSDVAKRIAVPLWGGLLSLTFLTICVIPAIYVIWRSFHLKKKPTQPNT